MNNDATLQRDVENELSWDPSVPAERVGVTVKDDVVQLDGNVHSLHEKWSAGCAALRVTNVKAVANELKVNLPSANERSDAEIAKAAISQLEWIYTVPETIKVKVAEGWITFEGTAEGQYQKDEAERVGRSLKGVKGVMNEILIQPKVCVKVVKESILAAFTRNAVIDAKNIQVETLDGVVTLRGHVSSWSERQEARRTASAAPGVTYVEDHLKIISLP